MLSTKGSLRGSGNSARGRMPSLSSSLNVILVLLLTISVVACARFVEVVGAQQPSARLKAYKPPRPSPVVPLNLTVQLPQVWEKQYPGLPLICLPVEQGFDLKAWVKEVSRNQKAWGAYADYWENRYSVEQEERSE